MLPEKITILRDEEEVVVDTYKYIYAKTKDLQEFGYSQLTGDTVKEQLEKILNGEKLSVIGQFMKDDIVLNA